MARNDVFLNINALSPADAVVTGQQDMTAATVPELVLGDTPTFNFYFTDNTNVWPSWAGNAAYTVTWALSDAVSGDFSPAATTGNATPITGGWSIVLPLNAYDLVGLLNTKRLSQPYPVTNLWQQIRVADPSGNEITRAMFWTPVRYRAISDTQNTESASPTGGREVTVDNVNVLTTPTAAQFYAANPVPTSALGSAANGELLIGNGTGFTKATLTAGSGVSITNGSGSITISATDGDITLDDGTAAAPSLKFTADTDTGIYRPSDNVVGISAGGVSRATFGATSAINGTTIPGSKTLVVTTDKLSALAATTSAELAGIISDETGSGALVFATSPTLTTPILGTPQSGTLSSCTGLPISTGVSGLGTNVATFLATPSSANLASAVTDETGTGALVFANTPTLVTPNIGAATGTSFNLTGSGTLGTTLTVNSTTDSSSKDTGAIVTEGGLGVEKSATIGGNLTVSGTGTSSFGGVVQVSNTLAAKETNASLTLQPGPGTGGINYAFGQGTGDHVWYGGTTERMRLTNGGNVGIGTTSPSGFLANKLVIATGGSSNEGLTIYTSNNTRNTSLWFADSTTGSGLYAGGIDYQHATDEMVFYTNSQGNVRITSGGNLTVSGTGTSSVAGSLDVGTLPTSGRDVPVVAGFYQWKDDVHAVVVGRGSVANPQQLSLGVNQASTYSEIQATQAGVATNKLILNRQGGNVLIGTTTDSGNGKLQLATGAADKTSGIGFGTDTSLYRVSAGNVAVDSISGTNPVVLLREGSVNKGYFATSSGAMFIGTHTANSIQFQTNITTALTLDSSQNATFAGTSVTVDGASTGSTLTLKRASNANGAIISYKTTTTSKWYHGLRGLVDDNWYLQNDVAGNTALFFDASTSNATFAGTVTTSTTNSSQNAGNGNKFISSGAVWVVNAATNDAFSYYNSSAAAYRFYVDSAGTISATNTAISAISDVRLKENIRDLSDALSSILALKPRVFDWKEGKGANKKNVRGFIAQEIEQVFPDLVDEWKDAAPEGEAPYKSVRQDLIPVLVKAIQELTARVVALENA